MKLDKLPSEWRQYSVVSYIYTIHEHWAEHRNNNSVFYYQSNPASSSPSPKVHKKRLKEWQRKSCLQSLQVHIYNEIRTLFSHKQKTMNMPAKSMRITRRNNLWMRGNFTFVGELCVRFLWSLWANSNNVQWFFYLFIGSYL